MDHKPFTETIHAMLYTGGSPTICKYWRGFKLSAPLFLLHCLSYSGARYNRSVFTNFQFIGFETNDIASYNYIISNLKVDRAMSAFLLSFCSESFYHCSVWLLVSRGHTAFSIFKRKKTESGHARLCGSMLYLLPVAINRNSRLHYYTIKQAYNKLQANYKQIAIHYIQEESEHVITFVP